MYDDPEIWVTKEGEEITIFKLSNDHLVNIIIFLRKKGYSDSELYDTLPSFPRLIQEAESRNLMEYIDGVYNEN